ncbi:MAG: efflux RND transporter periplasmic adaptor subunit [Nitrospinota bacterium]
MPGIAIANKELPVSSLVSGKVLEVKFEKGSSVKRGSTLITIDDAEIKAQKNQLKSKVALAKLEYDKLKALHDLDAAVSEFSIQTAKLKLEDTQFSLETINEVLKKYQITAGISGVAVDRHVEQGEIITVGQVVTKILNLDPIKVRVGVPEQEISNIELKQRAKVSFDSLSNKKSVGVITYISPEIDSKSQTFVVEVTVENKDHSIVPNMSSKVMFSGKLLKDVISIPQTAILELPDEHAVFIVDKSNKAKQVTVEVEDHMEEDALISSGLKENDMLVIKGHRSLVDGDPLLVVE